jgi:hypothetical protein
VRVEKRVRALERRFKSDPVVLYFGDGSTREIRGPRDFMLRLLVATAWGGDLSPGQQEQLELIRASVDSVEPDGGHLIDVFQCYLRGPAVSIGSSVYDSGDEAANHKIAADIST